MSTDIAMPDTHPEVSSDIPVQAEMAQQAVETPADLGVSETPESKIMELPRPASDELAASTTGRDEVTKAGQGKPKAQGITAVIR
eukprot:1194900-Prorocentrum_minimum.AAC.2